MTLAIINLENEKWTEEVGLDINDPIADRYRLVQANGALSLVMCSDLSYSGWLAKQVSTLPGRATRIDFGYSMTIDDATLIHGQVAETDSKYTDNDGWTYDLSAQWEMVKAQPKGWMFQIDHAGWSWTDTGIVIPTFVPYEEHDVVIEHAFDYTAKTSAVLAVSVDGARHPVPADLHWIPAREEGWEAMQIVTQMQQCNRNDRGGYTLRFRRIEYREGL